MTRDVFGWALRDRLDGRGDGWLTVERDDGFTDRHPVDLYFRETLQPLESALLDGVTGHVLDIGCGAGRALLAAEATGLSATGIDLSPGAVEVARRRGACDVRRLDVMKDPWPDDLTDLGAVLLFGHNIGIGGDPEGAVRLLSRAAGRLSPGGAVLLTSIDVVLTTTPEHLAYHARNRAAGRLPGEIRIRLRHGALTGDWHPWIHLSPAELSGIAARAGLVLADVRDSGQGPYAARLGPG